MGRRRQYCRQSCRQRAYEQRAMVKGTSVPPDAVVLSADEAAELSDRVYQVRCAAEDVATALIERGIGVEAGLWHESGVAAWGRSPLREQCERILVEVPATQDAAEARATADRLVAQVRSFIGTAVPILLHGEDGSTWTLVGLAAERGLATRIGLEDVLVMPDGSAASGNAELVAAAAELVGLV